MTVFRKTEFHRAIWHMIEANGSISFENEPIAFEVLVAELEQWDDAAIEVFIEKWAGKHSRAR